MVAEVASAFNCIKSVSDILKTLINIRDTNMINGVVAEANSLLIAAQSEVLEVQAQNSALIDSKRELEEKITDFEKWETEKSHYHLEQTTGGSLIYTVNNEFISTNEPPHHICANCYNKRIKSFLHRTNVYGVPYWHCDECKFKGEGWTSLYTIEEYPPERIFGGLDS